MSSSTIASTVGRESLVASARVESRGCGSVERTAARMAAAFVARRSATPTTAGSSRPGECGSGSPPSGHSARGAEAVDGERSLDVANDQPPVERPGGDRYGPP